MIGVLLGPRRVPRIVREDPFVASDNHPPLENARWSVMDQWTIEATLPKPAEVESLVGKVAPGTEIFLSTLPHVSLDQQIETAKIVRAQGFEPVLHLAARYFATRTELVGYLSRANRECQADRVLAIGGDLDRPRGEFSSAARLISSGLLEDYGIRRIGLAAYPDGHPKISDEVLPAALDEKLGLAAARGLEVQVVTQFGFDADPILAWFAAFRQSWPETEVKIGLAGPTGLNAILRYAMRCGVKAPARGLAHKLSLAKRLAGTYSPDEIIAKLDEAGVTASSLPHVSAHLFSFGGLARTAEWAAERSSH